MPARQGPAGVDNYILQEAISAYSDEAYTNAKKLTGTGIVGTNDKIDTSTESYIGQVRWNKPMNPTINVASLTDATDGTTSNYGTDMLTYVKTVRTYGGKKVNMAEVVSQVDGLAKVGRDFAEHRAQDEHDALLAVLKGVATSELLLGSGSASGSAGLGGQNFDNDPTDKKYGFYVDLGANKLVGAATAANQGAQRAEGFLQAFGMAWKDYEPEYAYLIASPETISSLRSANLVDQDRVVDGNITFSTIFQGKLRLIQTRANQGFTTAELALIAGGAGVNIVGTKTSFIVLPGSLALKGLAVPDSVEIDRNAAAYKGGGTTTIWNRWGYVLAPAGYDWNGSEEEFPTNASYKGVVEGGAFKTLAAATSGLATTTGTWTRKTASALSLGILPVMHS
jgi:hypothetical protein